MVALRAVQMDDCLAGPKATKMAGQMVGTMAQWKYSVFRWAVTSASLIQRDSWKVAHLAGRKSRDSLMAAHLAGMMAVTLASQKTMDSQRADHWVVPMGVMMAGQMAAPTAEQRVGQRVLRSESSLVALRAGHWVASMAVRTAGHWVALMADSRVGQREICWETSSVALRAAQRDDCLAGAKAGKTAEPKAGTKAQSKCSVFHLVAMWASLIQRGSWKVAHLACQTRKDS